MRIAMLGIGLVFCIEGLVFALAPRRLEDLFAALRALSPDARRMVGLAALGCGVLLIWIARLLGG